jgi:hypothetical protein
MKEGPIEMLGFKFSKSEWAAHSFGLRLGLGVGIMGSFGWVTILPWASWHSWAWIPVCLGLALMALGLIHYRRFLRTKPGGQDDRK